MGYTQEKHYVILGVTCTQSKESKDMTWGEVRCEDCACINDQ